jgi:citrate synthase
MGVLACQPYSHFLRKYNDGLQKDKYWEPILEDALNVIAKLPRIAAIIYNKLYREVSLISS